MSDRWTAVSAARIPSCELVQLASLRNLLTLRVHVSGEVCWLSFPAGETRILEVLQPVAGVRFYYQEAGQWYRSGSRVPTAEQPPSGEGRPLTLLLNPTGFSAVVPPGSVAFQPVLLTLVRGGGIQPTSALRCKLIQLQHWINTATTQELARVQGAHCGEDVLLVGEKLPVIPESDRFWGKLVLMPLGHVLSENFSETTIRASVGATEQELILIEHTGATRVPKAVLKPLTRAGLKMALVQ